MTKIIFAIAGAVMILAAPVLAANRQTTGRTYPHVYSGGSDQGTDPSGLVRLDLLRDPRSP